MKAREIAYHVLVAVEEGAYANLKLDEYLRNKEIPSLDKGFITELVYGTVKYQLRLDWMIDQLVAKKNKLQKGPRIILRLAFYQLTFMDKVPVSAATNEAVKLAKKLFHTGVAGLINGVLRNYLRDPDKISWPDKEKEPVLYLSVYYSHPEWMVERWLKRYGLLNTEKICSFNNKPADLWVRTNTLRINRDTLMQALINEGCDVEISQKTPEGLWLKKAPSLTSLQSFQKGLFTVQDESSMLVAHALSPKPNDTVLDVCAGPGGKSTHLAQLMEDKGEIVACDVHKHRLKLIEENANRLGISIIAVKLQDATHLADSIENGFQYILVDAPCSGLGVLRRRADARWRKTLDDINVLTRIQREILENVIGLLLPGGKLIYSTCTLEPEENISMINAVLNDHPELKPIDFTDLLPYQPVNEQEKRELKMGYRQYFPYSDNMEGFFIAGLTRSI